MIFIKSSYSILKYHSKVFPDMRFSDLIALSLAQQRLEENYKKKR